MKTIEDHHDEIHTSEPADWRTPVDYLEPEDEETHDKLDVADIGQIPPDALRVFVSFLVPVRSKDKWKTATARLAALAHVVGTDGIASRPLSAIAAEIGCCKSLLSLYAVELADFGGTHSHGGKSAEARQTYADRARAVWGRRSRERKAHVTDGLTPQAGNETRSTSIV